MDTVENLSKQLSRQDTQPQTLSHLLHHLSLAHDVTPAAERLYRHILDATSPYPSSISHALDLLLANPSHNYWPQTLAYLIKSLQSPSVPIRLLSLSKLPALPHRAWQHILLFAASELRALLNDGNSRVRRATMLAVAAAVMRERPLTTDGGETVRLQSLQEKQVAVVRGAVESLMYGLLGSVFDLDDAVAATALDRMTAFAIEMTKEKEISVLGRAAYATGGVIWTVLLANCAKIAPRFDLKGKNSRAVVRGLSRLAATALGTRFGGGEDVTRWALGWVDAVLSNSCEGQGGIAACSGLLLVCSYAEGVGVDKVAAWGTKAVKRLVRILGEEEVGVAILSAVVDEIVRGLAALSKNDAVNGKFIVSVTIGLLPIVGKCPRREERLEAIFLMASSVVEHDLSGRDIGIGTSLKAVLNSAEWKMVMKGADDSELGAELAAEVVCCFSQSLLEASRKIAKCEDQRLKSNLTQTWAVMLALLMNRTRICLSWPYTPAVSYARELNLKVFDALGQYAAFLMKTQGVGMEEYERLQEALVKETLEQNEVGTRASLLICVTKYWLTSGMKAEANIGHVLKAIWKHAQEHYHDEEIILRELRTGALWSDAEQGFRTKAERAVEGGYKSMTTALTQRTRAVIDTVGSTVTTAIETRLFGSIALATAAAEGSTLTTDFAYSSLLALLAIVSRNPPIAERAVKILRKYMEIMEDAESADFIVLEAVRNTISAIEMYQDEFYPKIVQVRDIPGLTHIVQERADRADALAWVKDITESCVFASSRLEDSSKESSTVETEEAILHTAIATKRRLRAFNVFTLDNFDSEKKQTTEGEHQTLNGASDPFSVVASHSMDTVKGLAIVRVDILNRSAFRASNVALVWSASGALTPLPDSTNLYKLGNMEHGISVTQRLTLSVRTGQGYAGRVFFSIQTWRDGADEESAVEQSCAPYYIPSSDVLLLRKPPANAGVDVFRRRWDLMRHFISFQVHLDRTQSVDSLVDTLERRSKCLRQVGRMRTYSHVCALVADSSGGDYVAVAVLAPEARGISGIGPCVLYVTIRSNSMSYNRAFRAECRDWLSNRFRVIFPDEELSEEAKALALKPQDAYFITEPRENLSPYQRWRVAHAVRMKY